jgi:protein ImuA
MDQLIKNSFSPALKSFGVEPDKIIFITVTKEKDMLWVMEEALKCEGLCCCCWRNKGNWFY